MHKQKLTESKWFSKIHNAGDWQGWIPDLRVPPGQGLCSFQQHPTHISVQAKRWLGRNKTTWKIKIVGLCQTGHAAITVSVKKGMPREDECQDNLGALGSCRQ